MDMMRRAVSGALAMLIAATCMLCACSGDDDGSRGVPTPADVSDSTITSPYNWDCLVWMGDDRLAYIVDGEERSRVGIDVSEHQGAIDWHAVADDGISFCYIRVAWRGSTEGGLYADERFEENLVGAQEAGIDVGLYVYSQATNAEEGREEAEFVLDLLGGRELELPIAFDHEVTSDFSGRADNMARSELTAAARAFCDTVEEAGYSALIYGNSYEFSRLEILSFAGEGYWFAEYDEAPSVPLDLYVWQYTHQGSVDGIETTVDMNIELVNVLDGEDRS